MKIVIAPDSFKGSVSAVEACRAIALGVKRARPDCETVSVPMADGGEGTVEALVAAVGGRTVKVKVAGPLGEEVEAEYGILEPVGEDGNVAGEADSGKTAVIEMAAAAGLPLVPLGRRNPLETTTFGVGQLILDAVGRGCRNFIIGVGGSATNDCGCGMAAALGVKFLDGRGKEITGFISGGRLGEVADLDWGGMDSRLVRCKFTVACDVRNPLLGLQGASYVYAVQKGADREGVELLEDNLSHAIDIIEKRMGKAVRDIPGAGAAGGLGAGLMVFLDAELEEGVGIVLRYSQFDRAIRGADLLITGEGRIDSQSAFGKTIAGVTAAARKHNVPVVALAGTLGDGFEKVIELGVGAVFSICPGPMELEQAISGAGDNLSRTSEQVVRLILISH